MSKANGATTKKDTYLQHVSLKNYKSIKDVEIDFKPGLNIIIGKNGSGKTNFVSCLNNVLKFDYQEQPDTESDISVFTPSLKIDLKATINNNNELFNKGPYNLLPSHLFDLSINEDKHFNLDVEAVKSKLMENGYLWGDRIISHSNPYIDSFFVEKPITLTLMNNGKRSVEGFFKDYVRTYFTTIFYFRLFNMFPPANVNNIEFSMVDLKENILDYSNHIFEELNNNLKTYSSINQIRVNPDFKLLEEDSGNKISITNFYIEFNINDQWLPFRFLSDGTKRLFYIISEFTNHFNKNMSLSTDGLEIVLLEEPELGIHPHQLHQLMEFIKEQSKEKQTILTTHSPQVLDILESDQLDRVIICHYDSNKGTQLSHLSQNETQKAKKYMQEEAFLSDYWRFSDLEPAS